MHTYRYPAFARANHPDDGWRYVRAASTADAMHQLSRDAELIHLQMNVDHRWRFADRVPVSEGGAEAALTLR